MDEAMLAVYRQAAQARQQEKQARLDSRFEHAWLVARRAAALLKDEFRVTKVVAFGSLVNRQRFHLRSDIDLATWDLDELQYYRAAGVLLGLDPAFEIDLVCFEEARPALQAAILGEGVEI
jgi:predicted nucleotidyltransferase